MAAVRKPKVPGRLTVKEFLAWCPPGGYLWQLVDGTPQAMSPPGATHGAIQGEVAGLLRAHLLERDRPCRVVVTPGVVPRVQSQHNMRVPDLAVTCAPDTAEVALPDPVLIVEILSPSNEAETWANVWAYTTIPSVREILILRSVEVGAELLRRGPDGNWPTSPERVAETVVLESIGFAAPLRAAYRTTRLGQG
ncbi:MAG TPA: Uma2 family endonuclease [Crenalkalicoccus sp.]|jgi:Uma2 family endonuclease|nr:Uma2 family endonuclease [Crenalkalicoccus sp.]